METTITTPHLRWINWKGQQLIHVLNSDEVVIGRKAGAHVVLDSTNISRHHAKIIRTDQGDELVDLSSAHGTFLNDEPVSQPVKLNHGDKIGLGTDRFTLFYFTREPEEQMKIPLPAGTDGSTAMQRSFANLTRHLSTERSELEKLSYVLDFQYQWGQMFTPEAAFQQILQSALNISNAERGFVLVKEPNGFRYAAGIDGQGQTLPQSHFRTSRSVIDQVMTDRKAVFMTEGIGGKFAQQASIMDMGLRAIACAPLYGIPVEGDTPEILGILYLDGKKAMHRLSGLDQKILGKLAMEAGSVLEKVELIRNFEQRKKYEEEMALAEETQKSILPQSIPSLGNFCIRALCKPTRYVGGDFYNFFMRESGELVAVLGDVAGKGMPAALLSSMILGCLDMQLCRGSHATEILRDLNKYLCAKPASNRFVTLFLLALDSNGAGRFISAGHPAAYVFRAASGEIEGLDSNCLLLGAFMAAEYGAIPLQLDRGDVLLVYSDGLTEAENADDDMFGADRVKEVLQRASPAGAASLEQQLLRAIDEFTQGTPQTDDITLVIVERME